MTMTLQSGFATTIDLYL